MQVSATYVRYILDTSSSVVEARDRFDAFLAEAERAKYEGVDHRR